MINTYKIEDASCGDIPFIVVWGSDFCYEDLYDLVGKAHLMTNFTFKVGSEAFTKLGQYVTGVICYDKDDLEGIESRIHEKNISARTTVYIDCRNKELTQCQREDVKNHSGVSVSDIEYIFYNPCKREEERYDSGEKIVPNIITLESGDDSKLDGDILYLTYIVQKYNHGTELIQYEKEKYVGIKLAVHDKHIDPRLLKCLEITDEDIEKNCNLGYHYHKVKERRHGLTEDEKIALADLEFIRLTNNIIIFTKEVLKSKCKADELKGEKIETIKSILKDFEPEILVYGKKQVYWDLQSYLHIAMGHIKSLQMSLLQKGSSAHLSPVSTSFSWLIFKNEHHN